MIGMLLTAAAIACAGWRWRPPPTRVAALVPRRPGSPPLALVITVGAVAAALLVGPTAALALAVGAPVLWHWRRLRAARRRVALVQRELPEVVELLAATVEAGCTLAIALPLLAPLAPSPFGEALAAVARRQERGERLADALAALTGRLGEPVAPLVAALAGCERNGLPLAPTLARLASEARHDRRRRAEAAARALPVRLAFPLVLCLLPAFVLLGIVPAMAPALRGLHLSEPALPLTPLAVGSSP